MTVAVQCLLRVDLDYVSPATEVAECLSPSESKHHLTVEEEIVDVAMIDDHHLFLEHKVRGVVDAIDELSFTGSVPTVAEFLGEPVLPDIAVLDLQLGDGSSPADNVGQLLERGIRVLVFTSGDDPYLVRSVAACRIHGLIRKSETPDMLAEALRRVADDNPEFTAEWASAIDTDPRLNEAGLTAREKQVLTLYAQGQKGVSVARDLGMSGNTLPSHIRSIRTKYEAIGRAAPDKVSLYKRAVEDGYVPAPTLDVRGRVTNARRN